MVRRTLQALIKLTCKLNALRTLLVYLPSCTQSSRNNCQSGVLWKFERINLFRKLDLLTIKCLILLTKELNKYVLLYETILSLIPFPICSMY